MGKSIDLTENVYGKLKVVRRVENRGRQLYWLCECFCGNKKEIRGADLKNGKTKSCKECSKHQYEFKDNYVIGHTAKGEDFLIDLDDYEEVSKHSWRLHIQGYIVSNKNILLHRLITKPKKSEMVDHINHKKFDNRRCNLRVCSSQENQRNQRNVKGYTWNKAREKYQSNIMVGRKNIYIGLYATEDEVRLAYCTKALELFGEFAHRSVREDFERLSKGLNEFQLNKIHNKLNKPIN